MYTGPRLGIFTALSARVEKGSGFGVKLAIGSIAGAVGAMVGNPADVALIRMSADGRLPPAARCVWGMCVCVCATCASFFRILYAHAGLSVYLSARACFLCVYVCV